MKTCPYCGKENKDDATACWDCGTELPAAQAPRAPQPMAAAPSLLDGNVFSSSLSFEEGFHRVDWQIIIDWVEAHVSAEERNNAWTDAARSWVGRLRDDLGAGYVVRESREFILLADLPEETAARVLHAAENAAAAIRENLRPVAWGGATSKGVMLVFAEEDDYYQYVSYYERDGIHPRSGGVYIHLGYGHIAMPWQTEFQATSTIVHELTHECVAHLSLPIWLNEGVAVVLEKEITPARGRQRAPVMEHELAERHFAFWNEQNIQSFWAGTSFHEAGDSNELSYSLAEVLVRLLTEKGKPFLDFLNQAQGDDAGQTAALEILGTSLGDIAGTFLGEGDWRPRRKAIVDCWKAAGWMPPVPADNPEGKSSPHAP